MTDVTTLHIVAVIAIGCLAVLAYLAWHRQHFCPECSHCARIKREQEAEQERLQHDQDHRWLGYCKDETCPRNPRRPPRAGPPTP